MNPCASPLEEYRCLLPDFLEVKNTPEYGRGVYSRKKLVAGTNLVVSIPVAHVISQHERGRRCDWCLCKEINDKWEGIQNLQKCSHCKFVRYCNRACQRSDWPFHKMECKDIARISPKVPNTTIRLILRLLVKKELTTQISLPNGAEWEMDVLTTHAPRYNEELKQLLAEQVFGAKLLMTDGMSFDMELAFKTACKIMSNCFSILDWEMNSIGSGIYIVPALLNHSCDPNCIAIFDGYQMKLRTVQDVPSGDQLFVSYTDLLDTRERRQKHLQKYYLFTCCCPRCSDEDTESLDSLLSRTVTRLTDKDTKQLLKEGFQQLDEVEKLKKNNEWTLLVDITTKYLKDNRDTLGDKNVLIMKMRECLMDAHIELGQWKEALEEARALKDPYELFYSHMNPFLGLHLFKMTKLIQQVSDETSHLQESMKLLDRAIGILSITHGSEHSIVEEGKTILHDTNMELTRRDNQR